MEMVNIIFVFVSFFALVIHVVAVQRISNIKCAEYSLISRPTDPKIQPHMVWMKNNVEQHLGYSGVLVSEKFVLTSAYAAIDLVLLESQVYFTNDDRHIIIEKFIHPNYIDFYNHNIALVQFEGENLLNSSHRPACLWTTNYYGSSHAEIPGRCNTCTDFYFFQKETVKILTMKKCNNNIIQEYTTNASSHFCVLLKKSIENNTEEIDKINLIPDSGTYIQVYRPETYLEDNYYIYGVVAYFVKKTNSIYNVGITTYSNLDWIESIVWPVNQILTASGSKIKKENCGTVFKVWKPLTTASFALETWPGEFPWHAAIYKSRKHGHRTYICGGTLLNEYTVLTAAHCVSLPIGFLPATNLIVVLGRYSLDIGTMESRETRIDRVMPHENFSRIFLENDIAILKLKTPVQLSKFIQPICFTNDSTIFSTTVGVTAGWGENEHGLTENTLKKVSMPIKTDRKCRESNRNVFPMYLNGKNFCAGYQNGTSVCPGDSGGGLLFQRNEQWYIGGIVSLGVTLVNQSKCDVTELVLFTDVTKYYDWILDKL